MQKIGIISLGLIGGSILKSLSNIKDIELLHTQQMIILLIRQKIYNKCFK
ncbi:MAG: hypothetical protein L6V95_04795 [Candidatus Melainabacteria bacterium]|nr:MAG: hypothetical protein L6V95_04795 [Candidatus Melainabacteria bacterium]